MCINYFNLLVHQFYVVFCSENFNITIAKPIKLAELICNILTTFSQKFSDKVTIAINTNKSLLTE